MRPSRVVRIDRELLVELEQIRANSNSSSLQDASRLAAIQLRQVKKHPSVSIF